MKDDKSEKKPLLTTALPVDGATDQDTSAGTLISHRAPVEEANINAPEHVPILLVVPDVDISRTRAYLAVVALSCGTFALGTNEFVPLGFLPKIAKDFSISITTTAWISSSFMLGAAVSSPLIAITTARVNRKYLLMALQTLLVGGTTICALSPKYSIMLVGRVMSAFAQAAYMGVGSVTAASLFPESKKGFAVSLFLSGFTLSNLVGVPLDTLLGNKLGWRYIFWPITGFAALSTLGIMCFLPTRIHFEKSAFKKQLSIFKKPDVWLALLSSTFGYSGMLASHTYFAEMMTDLAKFSANDITWLTVLYGAGAVAGNIVGGKSADKSILWSVVSFLFLLAALLASFTFSVVYKIPAAISLFANAFFGFSLISPLMRYTITKAPEGPDLAAATNISAFGVGIALGIYLESVAIDHGYGYRSPNWVGSSLTLLGLVFVLIGELQKKLCCRASVATTTIIADVSPRPSESASLIISSSRSTFFARKGPVPVCSITDSSVNNEQASCSL